RRDQQYTYENDAEDLITDYGARPARWRGCSFCPLHLDDQVSLQVYAANGHRSIHCLSQLSDCPLARRDRNAAFRVSGIGAGLDSQVGLRPLDSRGQPYYAPAMCRRVLVTT